MGTERPWHRLLRWAGDAWRNLMSMLDRMDGPDGDPDIDPDTAVTFRAITDAVLPETPELEEKLGADHGPGGLATDLDAFHASYVDDGFQFGLPHLGFLGNVPVADPVAEVLDLAAATLVERGDNESEPSVDRAVSLIDGDEMTPAAVREAAGTFAKLSRRDRLRAIAVLDELEVEFSLSEDDLFELDAGLVGQLVVGFAEMIYYSEWQGYDEFDQPPSDRSHPNDQAAVQSWRQTGYPGFADGYAALRGYVGTPDGPLGDGDTWATIEEGATIDEESTAAVQILRESGSFRENEYDTTGYEEPYPE
jgi:hypothetical protein